MQGTLQDKPVKPTVPMVSEHEEKIMFIELSHVTKKSENQNFINVIVKF